MDLNAHIAVADRFQAPPTDGLPVQPAPLTPALDILRHLKSDADRQSKEPVRPLAPIMPVAN